MAGISGILHGLFAQPPGDRIWRMAFIAGLVVAGVLWRGFAAVTQPELNAGGVALAGVLVGLGTRVGGGCTSGHGVCGLGRLSFRSLVAVAVFMLCGMIAVFVVRHA
jgi:uncharacterized membrane protein YedE/YeeE